MCIARALETWSLSRFPEFHNSIINNSHHACTLMVSGFIHPTRPQICIPWPTSSHLRHSLACGNQNLLQRMTISILIFTKHSPLTLAPFDGWSNRSPEKRSDLVRIVQLGRGRIRTRTRISWVFMKCFFFCLRQPRGLYLPWWGGPPDTDLFW